MITQAALVAAVERHIADTGTTATAFGRKVAGDPNLVFDLRNGRCPQLRLAERIMREVEQVAAQEAMAGDHAAKDLEAGRSMLPRNRGLVP